MEKKFITELISTDFKEWETGDKVILDAGTGSGKTTFCIDILGRYAKEKNAKLLYICNRTNLKNQVLKAVFAADLNDTIYVTTYQSIQSTLYRGDNKLEEYDYLISDECHFFFSDASFNRQTDLSYRYVMGFQGVTLFASATANKFFDFLEDSGIVKKQNRYISKREYGYVNDLTFYRKADLVELLNRIITDTKKDKILVFLNSTERMKEMHTIFGESAEYIYSKSNREMKKHLKLSSLKNEQFEARILFATKVIDNGINFCDSDLNHIFCELVDADGIIQAFGRKRCVPHEHNECHFYIRERTAGEIRGMLNRLEPELIAQKIYRENPDRFRREYSDSDLNMNIFRPSFDKTDPELVFNRCRYVKNQMDYALYSSILASSFREYILNDVFPELREKEKENDIKGSNSLIVKGFIEKNVEKNLYEEEKKQLKEIFQFLNLDIRKRGHKNLKILNATIEEEFGVDYPYRIFDADSDGKKYRDTKLLNDDGTVNPHRYQRFWRIESR